VAVDGQVRPPSVFASVALVIVRRIVKLVVLGLRTCNPREMLLREIAISKFEFVLIYIMASPEETFINLFEVICVIVVIACYNCFLYFLFDILFSYFKLTGNFPWKNVFHLGIKP
jgi:hypothetical protein